MQTVCGSIPMEAARWILAIPLEGFAHLEPEVLQTDLSRLSLLLLKRVCVALGTAGGPAIVQHLKGFQGRRKADSVQKIRACLYEDYPMCQRESALVRSFTITAQSATMGARASNSQGRSGNGVAHPTAAAASGQTVRTTMASAARFIPHPATMVFPNFAHPHVSNNNNSIPFGAAVATVQQRYNCHPGMPHPTTTTTQTAGATTTLAGMRRNHAQAFGPSVQHAESVAPGDVRRRIVQATAQGIVRPSEASHDATSNTNGTHKPTAPFDLPQGHCTLHAPPPPQDAVSSQPSDPETTPQSIAEHSALTELLQMSFTDKAEILASYRNLQRTNHGRAPTTDEVMFDLIHQREEAEEAKKMDAARIESEKEKYRNSGQRRREEMKQELQALMETVDVEEWRTNRNMFVHSWLLRGIAAPTIQQCVTVQKTEFKLQLLKLLQIEKKARQWYKELPKSYFCGKVSQRIVTVESPSSTGKCRDAARIDQIREEIEKISLAMYQLSEQLGDVPKIFRDAHDEDIVKGCKSGIMLKRASPTTGTAKVLTSKGERPPVHCNSHHDVIEIL